MATSIKQMMDEANAAVPRISAAEAAAMAAAGNTVIIDVRDAPEVERSGHVAGAQHLSRGMLGFRADPQSPYYDKRLAPAARIVPYCASGGRAALGGKVLKDMGYAKVFNLGAFKDWQEAGLAVAREIEPGM